MKSEKPRRKGQATGEFQQVLARICYTTGKRADHKKMKAEEREEYAVDSRLEEVPGL
jgi:hypothetical protein